MHRLLAALVLAVCTGARAQTPPAPAADPAPAAQPAQSAQSAPAPQPAPSAPPAQSGQSAQPGEPPQPGQPAPSAQDQQLQRELEEAMKKDAAPAAATSPAPAPAVARGSQSLNPDISAIVDSALGWQRRPLSLLSGDDPALPQGVVDPGTSQLGATVQEVELAVSAIVDPYFKGEVYLTIPNLQGLEVEEAFATTTSLPWNLQAKVGLFRSAFGRQNGQHLHVQDFTRRPLLNAALLGADGLRAPGAQVSWLAPLPFFLTVTAEALSVGAPEGFGRDYAGPVASFGGGRGRDVTLTGEVKAFFPVGDDWSVSVGTSGATGVSAGSPSLDPEGEPDATRRSVLVGGDLYVKWKPANVAEGYWSLAWQTEAIFRHLGESDDGVYASAWDGGVYSQVVLQIARRWFLGVRGDVVGLPQSRSVLERQVRASASLTFAASEFARVRGYLETSAGQVGDLFGSTGTQAALLQLEFSIGAHGAHAF